jgi:putative ABC transport system permease protein
MKDVGQVPATTEQIRQVIHERHHITPPEQDDFSVVTAKEVADAVKGVSTTLAALLVALTILGLVVVGVVLMNILLISVGERTKEIGLRRALGATRRDVFLQFLTESLTVCLWGMILGCGLGWLLCIVLAKTTKLLVVVSWEPFAMAAVFALLVGTFFGVQPARRAAQLHPVEALK